MATPDKIIHGPSTIIGANVTLVGTLNDQGDITIHGTVDGEVVSERTVTIGETAKIKGPVTANAVIVGGSVKGAIEAKSHLEITQTGKVHGNIATADLTVRSGAVFIGKSSLVSSEESEIKEPNLEVESTDRPTEKSGYELE